MENNILEAVYIFDNAEGMTELRVPSNKIEQRNGWVLALYDKIVVAGVKEEYLKAFCLTPSESK